MRYDEESERAGRDAQKTQNGIETSRHRPGYPDRPRRRDAQKTQNGIETRHSIQLIVDECQVATPRKPRTGLKPCSPIESRSRLRGRDAQKTQNGIETLREDSLLHRRPRRDAQKTQNGIETRRRRRRRRTGRLPETGRGAIRSALRGVRVRGHDRHRTARHRLRLTRR